MLGHDTLASETARLKRALDRPAADGCSAPADMLRYSGGRLLPRRAVASTSLTLISYRLVPFGAMSSGTPVVAFNRGSVREVIEDGCSGFVVDTVEEAVEAVRAAKGLSRARVRRCFERRFTVQSMAAEYLEIYRALERVRLPAISLPHGIGNEAPVRAPTA
jgi:Glycosyl transferases group 1